MFTFENSIKLYKSSKKKSKGKKRNKFNVKIMPNKIKTETSQV